MYFAFEGGECCGKSSVMHSILEAHPEWVGVYEPGTTPLANKIRAEILSMERSSLVDAFLFATSRADMVEQLVVPALKAGKTVLSDRTFLTSVVYQGYAGNLAPEVVVDINKIAIQNIFPDVAFIFTLSYDAAYKRMNKRAADGGEITYFDKRSKEFYLSVQEGYKRLEELRLPTKFIYIDADKPADVLWREVEMAIKNELAAG